MASGFTVATNEHLIRDEVWSKQLKQLLLDDLFATKFVRILTDFPDGTVLTIPSIGEAETADFAEGQAVKYNKMDTGEFQFSFDQYKYSAHSISEKFKRDSYYASDVLASFSPRQHRAIMEGIETRILSAPLRTGGQTTGALNVINEANHRWIASGTTETMALADFARAHFALTKANVPMTNLVAIVDPTVAYTLQTQANITSLLNLVPQWENVVRTGIVTGMKFVFNIYGFDVYVSNYLDRLLANGLGTETIAGSPNGTAVTAGVQNLFFSAAPGDTLPFIGGFRQMPTVYSEFNKDLQQTEYLTITEYGFKVYRPENLVCVISDTAGIGL